MTLKTSGETYPKLLILRVVIPLTVLILTACTQISDRGMYNYNGPLIRLSGSPEADGVSGAAGATSSPGTPNSPSNASSADGAEGSDGRATAESSPGESEMEGSVRNTLSTSSEAEFVLRAFAAGYPDVISRVEYRDSDWAMLVHQRWFYWAEGRLLPEEQRAEPELYARYSFYDYPEAYNPPLREFTPEEITALESRIDRNSSSGIGRSSEFINDLWDIHDRVSSDAKVKTIYLFGRQVNVHRDLLEDLARAEERINELAETDPVVRRYVEGIGQITGYNWRQIASSSNRSLHSYGIAVDILPASYSRTQVYWLWARQLGLPWYSLPYEERFMPPEAVVQAFEDEGFIWGGKWLFFDTMHFEYRPEILELRRLRGVQSPSNE